jgi:hypothetical protein
MLCNLVLQSVHVIGRTYHRKAHIFINFLVIFIYWLTVLQLICVKLQVCEYNANLYT